MKKNTNVDLGSIKIHKKVLAEITSSAIQDVKGVSLISKNFVGNIGELLGFKDFPGISVTVDKDNQVTIEVKVRVEYGLSVLDIARQTQDAIRKSIEKTVDIDLTDVNVNIQGVERGDQ